MGFCSGPRWPPRLPAHFCRPVGTSKVAHCPVATRDRVARGRPPLGSLFQQAPRPRTAQSFPTRAPPHSGSGKGGRRGGHREGRTLPGLPHVLGGLRASLPQAASRLPRLPGCALPSQTRAVPPPGLEGLKAVGCREGRTADGGESPQGPLAWAKRRKKSRELGAPRETAKHRKGQVDTEVTPPCAHPSTCCSPTLSLHRLWGAERVSCSPP